MEPTIIGSIITAIGAIIVAFIIDINRKKGKKLNIDLTKTITDLRNTVAYLNKFELTPEQFSKLKELENFEQEILRLNNKNEELKIEIK